MNGVKWFSLRIPDEVYEALKALAERENRSLNGQILYILRLYLANLKKDKHPQA
jgi:hypothetical protein